ncbi:MFS transporter [Microbacterium pumilum]|uniref:MFS transporter n=2 Tax=Microbacterium pumilum TaxID=344165 RepID=A0ABN2RVR6_9MICO
MAADFGVEPVQIGLLISVWAATVILTSIPLSRASAAFDRRLVIGTALAVFALANLATAFVPAYGLAIGSRVVAALAHGVFWAVVIVYASSLLSPSHLGRGLSIVTAGGTAATVAGLPAATLLAQTLGWRIAFVVLALASLAIAAIVLIRMPRVVPERTVRARRDRGSLWRDPSLPAIAAFGAASVLIATAQFASFTYIRPYLEQSASIGADWTAGLLFVYGMAGMVGVVAAGFLADRFPRSALTATLLVFAAAFSVLTVWPGSIAAVVAGLVAWGFAIGAIFPIIQTALMRSSTDRTRTLASAGIVVLFNVGIAVGPWLGGMLGGATSPTTSTAVSAVTMAVAAAVGTGGVLLARHPNP